MDDDSISILDINQNLEKVTFNKWSIEISSEFDKIKIEVIDLENIEIYENIFFVHNFNSNSLFSKEKSNKKIINKILDLIKEEKIEIENNKNNLKILFPNNLELLLSLNKNKNINKLLKEKIKSYQSEINELRTKINEMKNENNLMSERINKLEEKNNLININENIKEENDNLKNEKEINNNKIKENKNIQKITEIIKKEEIKEEMKEEKKESKQKINLKKKKTIKAHSESILSMSQFPTGEIISSSADKSIKIWDKNFNLIQNITNAHDNWIYYISIKDKNNFASCSNKIINIWIKQNEKFILNETINAHKNKIKKILYFPNGIIISCSFDKTIKIFKEDSNNNNQHTCIKQLSHKKYINSILFIEEKNILISSSINRTNIWNFLNYELIISIKKAECHCWNAIEKIDNDRIILGGTDGLMKVISINEKKIIKEINNNFLCNCIYKIKNKNFFLVGGDSENNNINIYNSNNYQFINFIPNAHSDIIIGFLELDNGTLLSYSQDKNIQCWLIEEKEL